MAGQVCQKCGQVIKAGEKIIFEEGKPVHYPTCPEIEGVPWQRWEIISFVHRPKEKRWVAISTAYVFPPVPYETLVSQKAKKSAVELEDMETLLFSPEVGETVGKTRDMGVGVLNHFSTILDYLEERDVASKLKEHLKL